MFCFRTMGIGFMLNCIRPIGHDKNIFLFQFLVYRNGFLLVRGLWDVEEVAKLRKCMEESEDIRQHAYGRSDGMGAVSKVSGRFKDVMD